MIEFIKTKRNYVLALALLFVLVSLSDTTYSLFLKSESTDTFTYNTGILDLQFVEDEQLTLQDAFPMNDSDAKKLTPYNLTIKNTGNIIYYFDLKMVSNETENAIDSRYIKVKVNDNVPINLFIANNIIASNITIYPGEEITFKINIWLDISTPNKELGKTFSAKITTVGNSIYKTVDSSGANNPKLSNDMLPVYYDEESKVWKIADRNNIEEDYTWYNYNEAIWANAVTLNDSTKKIYDLKRKNDLDIEDIKYNNGNIIIEDNYLDIKLNNYSEEKISSIFRIKFDNLKKDKIYIMSNGKVSYYYDTTDNKFIFKNGNQTVSSNTFNIEEMQWYIIGYTYDSNKVLFYAKGEQIGSANIGGSIYSPTSFKIGTDETFKNTSKITVGNVLIYNRILTSNEITTNYNTSMQIIYDGLLSGYNEFIPMTLKEYYLSKENGLEVKESDIKAFYVWIPRYKYRLWNVTGEEDIDSYEALTNGIEISFESGTSKTGIIYCEDNNCFNDINKTIKISSVDNNKYYNHIAFSSNNEELTGFWISKYELSLTENGTIESKAANNIWNNENLSTYYEKVKDENENYHIIKNTEWGAVAYLSHSKYGICTEDKCSKIEGNNNYVSGSNSKDSTTKNIYGVYDMVGSADEYTMTNITTNKKLNLNNTTLKNIPENEYELYSPNSFIIGDGTKEVAIKNINTNYNWMIRGEGLFGYKTSDDIKSENITTRIIIR